MFTPKIEGVPYLKTFLLGSELTFFTDAKYPITLFFYLKKIYHS
uniref:Uncharacterized protein n=1 Tax=Anguilla anguilla TaxID=7936 RepID=A0A0E9XGN5_ANGAN